MIETSGEKKDIVVVTGASGGIGSALVKALLSSGMRVVAISRNPAARPTGAPDAISTSEAVSHEHADLSKMEEVDALALRLQSLEGEIRWLIHCAGHIDPDGSKESLWHNFQVNTFAPIILSQSLAPKIAHGGGIVFISSTAGIWGSPASPLYSASKSALHGFAFALQKIIGQTKHIIVVAPGPTNTVMRESIAHDASKHQDTDTVAARILEIMNMDHVEGDQKLFVVRNGSTERIRIEPIPSR